jgi:hypothetical protein
MKKSGLTVAAVLTTAERTIACFPPDLHDSLPMIISNELHCVLEGGSPAF